MRWLLLCTLVAFAHAVGLLGIDYGAEFVKSSLVAPNSPFEVVITPDSQRKDASGLVITPTDGERLYGSRGMPLQSKFPQSALYSVKSLLGVPFNDLRMALFQEMHPGIKLVNTTRNSIAFEIAGETYTVEEVVAMQLRDIAVRATDHLREKTHSKRDKLQGLAISVPGNFGSLQRQALIDAAALANVDLAGLVSDGVAVGINYANSPAAKLDQRIVVYDLGASAASATLLNLQDLEGNVEITVEGYGSDTLTSGQSLTLLLRELLLHKFNKEQEKKYHPEAERTPRLLNRIWREAERAKQVLSANNEVHVHMENLANDEDLSVKITREEFEKEAEWQRQRVVQPLLTAVQNLPKKVDSIDQVVLVGGASRTPFVIEALKDLVGEQKLSRNVNADEANVQGTSMRGVSLARLFRTKKQFLVEDAVTYDYSVAFGTEKETTSHEDEDLESRQVFKIGDALDSTKTIQLPNDLTKLYLLEGRKEIGTWDLPYTRRSLESLKEESNCLAEPVMEAQFSIDKHGVIKLVKVEASCKAEFTSTVAPTTTGSSAEPTGTEPTSAEESVEAGETTGTESTTAESTASASTTSGIANKVKRISIKPSWEQAPISTTERAASRSKLNGMDSRDGNRQEISELNHQLETLAYRLRGEAESGEIKAFASDLLEFLEEGSQEIKVLQKKLEEALGLYGKLKREKQAEEEANEPIHDPIVDGSLDDESDVHDEL